jgi:hypothetical protein
LRPGDRPAGAPSSRAQAGRTFGRTPEQFGEIVVLSAGDQQNWKVAQLSGVRILWFIFE